HVNINVGISAFVPKVHTPFQWEGQNSLEELRKKQDYIRRAFRKRRINFKGQHVENSLLEAVFARADKDSALLLEKAWRLGCCFDGWSELFDFGKWELAAAETGIDLYEYASRSFKLDDELPWDFIDTGITKKFLKSEYQKAFDGEITVDCRESCCACGLECKDPVPGAVQGNADAGTRSPDSRTREPESGTKTKYRVRFSKTGMLRCLSHQELMTSISRAIRRNDIPVSYSTGFHPHPKISFGPALAVGIEGLNEYFDIEISGFINSADFLERLNAELPEGLKAHNADSIPLNARPLNDCISSYEYEIVIDRSSDKHINSFMRCQNWPVSRDKKTVDIRPMVEKAEIHGNILHLILTDMESAKVRLYEILKEMLQKTAEEIQAARIERIGLYGYDKIKQKYP
ncbi:MAG: TIGR03936 family radical SAM-associated protein, partial [Thermodesulfovibrionia bacterium]|nr:TIGR03936 family radical SAM-associated protein [Thermodesulfovibrionia bacterium]